MGFFTRCDDCEYWNKDKYLSIREGEGGYFARESYRDLEKCWCSVKREYVKSDEAMNCSRYKQKSSGCFLTTACVEYKGLADDCEELTKLRAFRDNYLKTTEEGKAVVEEYYRIAPQIVEKINASAKKAEIYDYTPAGIKLIGRTFQISIAIGDKFFAGFEQIDKCGYS